MKINIVCSDPTWIYGKFINKIGLYSKHKIFLNSKEHCDLNFLLPYYEFKNTQHPFISWQSHQELSEPLKTKFISVAKSADWCVCHAKKYIDVLKSNGIEKVNQILPGIDKEFFEIGVNSNTGKLIIGFVGKVYKSTTRKNQNLLNKISKLEYIDLRVSGGKIKDEDMPKFYEECDLIIQTSTIEGGSMSNLESLAAGRPFLCYDDVGTAREFNTGVIRVKFNDEQGFIKRIEQFSKNNERSKYRKLELIQNMRNQVKDLLWGNFVNKFDLLFEKVINDHKLL